MWKWQKTLPAAALSLGLTAGCTVEPNFPSQEELYDTPGVSAEYDGFFVRTKEGLLYTAQIHDRGILGMQLINLGRYKDPEDQAIRGVAFEQRVELKVQEGRVTGTISGTLPVDITSTREGDLLRFQGRMRGYSADFYFNERKLAGTLGRCSYALTRAEGQKFQGAVRCGELDVPVTVNLPSELMRWDDAEIGAALGVLLGGA